jgi:hypothetical protein
MAPQQKTDPSWLNLNLLKAIWSGNTREFVRLLSLGLDPATSLRLYGSVGIHSDYREHIAPALIVNPAWDGLRPKGTPRDVTITGHPLIDATSLGQVEMARMLIQRGAKVDACYDGLACSARVSVCDGGTPVVQMNNRLGHFSYSPLVVACANGDVEMARMLLTEGADVKARDGTSALQVAAESGHAEVVKLLLRHGADPQDRHLRIVGDNDYRITDGPLKAAAAKGHEAVVRALLEGGADARQVKSTKRQEAELPGAENAAPSADRPPNLWGAILKATAEATQLAP